jgi:septal ring factor EnvC (AmiA/AmiB activator)
MVGEDGVRPIARAGAVRATFAAVGLAVALVAGTACSSDSGEKDRSGAVTNLEEVGPELAELRNEIAQLNEIIRQLQAQVTALQQRVPPPPG